MSYKLRRIISVILSLVLFISMCIGNTYGVDIATDSNAQKGSDVITETEIEQSTEDIESELESSSEESSKEFSDEESNEESFYVEDNEEYLDVDKDSNEESKTYSEIINSEFEKDNNKLNNDSTLIDNNKPLLSSKYPVSSMSNALMSNSIMKTDLLDDIVFEVGVYTDAYRTNLELELLPEGVVLDGWAMDTTKFIDVDLSGIEVQEGVQYKIVVEMNPAIYLDQDVEPSLSNADVIWKKNDSLPANGLIDGYKCNNNSLEYIEYLLEEDSSGASFGLPIRYDYAIWNKQANAELAYGDTPLLNFYLVQVTEEGEEVLTGFERVLEDAITLEKHENSFSTRIYDESGAYADELKHSADTLLFVRLSQMVNIEYNDGFYYENLKFTIDIPKYINDLGTHYMKVDKVNFPVANGSMEYTTQVSDSQIVYDTFESYYSNKNLINQYFRFPDNSEELEDGAVFKGRLTCEADGVKLYSGSFYFILDNSAKADIKSFTGNGSGNIYDLETVQYLGTMALYNASSTTNESAVTIKYLFDVNNTNNIGVSTIRVPTDVIQEYLNIRYTLISRDGIVILDAESGEPEVFTVKIKNTKYKASSQKNASVLLNRSMLPVEHQEYFFKTLEFDINEIKENEILYAKSSVRSRAGAGSIWGYVLTDVVPDSSFMPNHTMLITSQTDGSLIESKTIRVSIDAGTTVAYTLSDGSVSSTSIVAGNSFTISGKANVVEYPYTSNNCIDNIILGFLLPDGISVNTDSVLAKFSDGSILKVDELQGISKELVSVGLYLWKIPFEKGVKIGWANESLKPITDGSSITFSVVLDTDIKMSTQSIKLEECVILAGDKRINGSSGSYSPSKRIDLYDLNGNGIVTDNIAGFLKDEEDVTIEKAVAGLVINAGMYDGGYVYSDEIDTFDVDIDYRVNISCDSGGKASDFFYLVPIPKEGNDGLNNFVSKADKSLELVHEVDVNTVGTSFKILYTTEDVNYNTAQSSSVIWSETLDDYSEATMIKIVVDTDGNEEGIIENGSSTIIDLTLKFSGSKIEFNKSSGMNITWSSRGFYTYRLGSNITQGHVSSKQSNLMFAYDIDEIKEIVLTAEAHGNPTIGSKLEIIDIPYFYLDQNFTIENLIVHEIVLVDNGYDFLSLTPSAKNETFNIRCTLNDLYVVDLLESDEIVLGSVEAETDISLKFELFNADSFTYTSDERYIKFDLVGDNGLKIPYKIIIETELSLADASSSILPGKIYKPFASDIKKTRVVQGSSFTSQFVTEFIPVNFKDASIVFDTPLSVNTYITMIDWTDDENPLYYYYVVDGSEGNEINLTSFKEMAGSNYFKFKNFDMSIIEKLLFICNLGDVSIGSNNITLRRIDINSNKIEETLEFDIIKNRDFDLKISNINQNMDSNLNVNLSLNYSSNNGAIGFTESEYLDRQLSLVLKGDNFEDDIKVNYNSNTYNLNTLDSIIIPLDEVHNLTDLSKGIDLTIESKKMSEINMDAELWVSNSNNGELPFMGDKVMEVNNITSSITYYPIFKIESMTPRLFNKDNLSSGISVSYVTDKINNPNITVELQNESGFGFNTVTNVISSVNNKYNHSSGVYDITDENGNILIKLNSYTIESGTWRLLFKIENEDGYKKEYSYKFIVK